MGRAGVEHPTFTLKRHPVLDVLNTLLIRKVYICFYFTLWKTKHLIKTLFIETITLITPLFGRVHFKTNYNYRLSNHCLINELILVTYALISNAVEKNITIYVVFFVLNMHINAMLNYLFQWKEMKGSFVSVRRLVPQAIHVLREQGHGKLKWSTVNVKKTFVMPRPGTFTFHYKL